MKLSTGAILLPYPDSSDCGVNFVLKPWLSCAPVYKKVYCKLLIKGLNGSLELLPTNPNWGNVRSLVGHSEIMDLRWEFILQAGTLQNNTMTSRLSYFLQ